MRILIAYDGSKYADAAVDDLQGAGLPRQCEATVVCVAHQGWPDAKHTGPRGEFENPWKATLKEAEAMAESARSRIQSLFPGWTVSSEPLWGETAKLLLKTISVWKPDLVVVGSHGRSAPSRLILGSVSSEILHHAPCSVRIVRKPPKPNIPVRILVATDGSGPAQECIDVVARRSWPENTEARVLAVMQSLVPMPTTGPALEGHTFASEEAYRVIEQADEQQRARLHEAVETAAERLQRAGLSVSTVTIDGDARHEVSAEAERWQATCVFVGARGLGAIDRLLLGSVSTAVVAHAPCAVEVIRHK